MRSRLAAACLTGSLLAALAAPVLAVSAIPDETGVELPFGARSAMVGDVDGDGVRELVSIRRWQNDPGRLAVEVSQIDDSGRLIPGGDVLLRRVASPEDLLTGGARPDGEGMLAVGAAEPARLLAWHVDGVERVIVAGVGAAGLQRPSGPTLWEVGLDPSGATELRFLFDSQSAGSSIYAIDLDGDGTDELVIGEPPETLRPDEIQLRVLRWDGASFSKASKYLSPALGSDFVPLGNSDGRPGEELGMIAVPNEANLPALLHRISLDDAGTPRTELDDIPFVGELAPMPGGDGGRILLASPGDGLRLLDWPADGEISDEATSPQRGFPLAVLGTGADARLLLRDEGVLHVLDDRLAERGVIERSAAAAQFRNSFLAPFGGQVPGGLSDDRPAVVFRGRLVTLEDGSGPEGDPLSQRTIAALPGVSPVGVFGPEGAWMALATATRFDAQRSGGRLTAESPIDPVRVTVAATHDVLRPEVDGGALQPTVSGAITEQRSAERPLLLAGGSFSIELRGPPGSSVALETGDPDDLLQLAIGVGGIARVTVEPPSPTGAEDEVFNVRLQVVTPAGHGYAIRWEVQILREPPAIAATTPVAPLSFNVPVRGRTDPHATVLVDGVPVEVRADGSFDAQVLAGPIPRDVRIQATDRVGNSAQHTLSVVGPVDFRRLPWIPVVAVLTVLAGAVLYLRAPRPTRPTARAGDDASFEEID